MQSTIDHLPSELSEALANVDFSTVSSGAQRLVMYADEYVVKYDPYGTSNTNELAWYAEVPEAVAPCRALRVDFPLPDGINQGNFLVMERAESIGDPCWDHDEDPDVWDNLADLCNTDLHDGNVGTLWDGRFVAIDMGCCHPCSGESGEFTMRGSRPTAIALAIATAFGVEIEDIEQDAW